ncbi:methylthioribose kinase [Thalassobacillus sp. CUG 92003]|uniref:DUF7147 family protein n=1 Tax=Thalassobacillus sp. CUG 92003 TaxID=2736641 RepID=UPI0015E74D04|nr:methylthioribose kinase [Thalassobacillus sp. CUG 92003]
MIQKFIELGEGYADIYELIELGKHMPERVKYIMAFHTVKNDRHVTSLALILHPAGEDKFQPIYMCTEGVPNPNEQPNKRYDLFQEMANALKQDIIEIGIKSSDQFAEKELFFQHLIGILRMNRYIPPLS